jgi:hypothetical protein
MARDHRQWGVDLFNATWDLIKSREDDDLMLHKAHASAYHWSQAPECTPANRARAEWLVSRVSALAGLPDAARRHGESCLRWCEENGIADWDLAFAYEALARAAKAAGEDPAPYVAKAAAVPIADAEDREALERDLATL